MSDAPSVTTWLQLLRDGDARGAEPLFRRYYERLVQLARAHLQASLRRVRDEEDLALSALDSFVRAMQAGRYPSLDNRDDLWRLLLTITLNKVRGHVRHEHAQRRGGGRERAMTDLPSLAAAGADLDSFAGPEPPPEVVAEFVDECCHRLSLLDEPLRPYARARMEGASEAEIAQQQGVTVRSVQRKLRLVRQIWTEAGVG